MLLHRVELIIVVQCIGGRATRIIMIQQHGSWGPLAVDLSGMEDLLTQLAVFPAFKDVMLAFGEKTSFTDDSFTTYRFQSSHDGHVKEMAYLLKHVEEHKREETDDPWSLRKSGVYHRSCLCLGESFIVLNPSRSLQIRINDLVARGTEPSAQEVHVAILSAAMEKWRWCIGDVEQRCLDMKTKAHLSPMHRFTAQTKKRYGEMEFDDIQDIQNLQDKAQVLQHALSANLQVMTELPAHINASSTLDFDDLRNLTCSTTSRLSSILNRLSATTDLVARILDFRSLTSLDCNSRMMAEMIQVANEENALIVELGKKASRDADVVKTLTLVALVYLPASFTTSLMSMDYIRVRKSAGKITFHFQGEFFVFLCLFAIFLLFTLGTYFVWYNNRKTHWKKDMSTRAGKLGGP